MRDTGRGSRWWADRDEPEDAEAVEDPWSTDGDPAPEELVLSEEQVRFLESLADQPPVPRISDSLPGLGTGDPGVDLGSETGD